MYKETKPAPEKVYSKAENQSRYQRLYSSIHRNGGWAASGACPANRRPLPEDSPEIGRGLEENNMARRHKWPVLYGGRQDTVFLREEQSSDKLGAFRACLITHENIYLEVGVKHKDMACFEVFLAERYDFVSKTTLGRFPW